MAWSDSSARAVLQLMVESVAEMIGFEVAALSVVIGDELVTMAYTGPEDLREYVEQSDPLSVLDPVLERAQEWGPRLRFLEGVPLADLEGHWIEVEQHATAHPDAWSASDALLAVLTGDDGAPVGVLSVDRPVTGRRPDERQRRLLERYAEQAERAVITASEREAMVQQIAHAEAARRMVRAASRPAHASLQAVVRETHDPLVAGFGARGSWLQVFQPDGVDVGVVRTHDGEVLRLPGDIVAVARERAPVLWAEQRVQVVTAEELPLGWPRSVLTHLVDRGLGSVLGVPLGVGDECVGFLALSRYDDQPPWSQVELDAALQVGHDLGAALVTARALESERTLVRELQQIDDHRRQLIATMSHELRTPLTVIAGNLEMLDGQPLDERGQRYHAAMTRGTTRMRRVVDDLLLLAQVSNPQTPLEPEPVDLGTVVSGVVDLVESTAAAKGLSLRTSLAEGDLVVPGDPDELDRLLANLVSNAVKYTAAGGDIVVSAWRRDEEVVVTVTDTGLGISPEDQVGLFRAFYRTSNPEALRETGTGLGLAIVAEIVERHGGRLSVSSALGEGTTFTVVLPAD